jgi:hypothetical protein
MIIVCLSTTKCPRPKSGRKIAKVGGADLVKTHRDTLSVSTIRKASGV